MDSTELHQPHGATLGSIKTSCFLVNMLSGVIQTYQMLHSNTF